MSKTVSPNNEILKLVKLIIGAYNNTAKYCKNGFEAMYVCEILAALLEHIDIIQKLNSGTKEKFVSAVKMHKEKYLKLMEESKTDPFHVKSFIYNCDRVIDLFPKKASGAKLKDDIGTLVADMFNNIQTIFSEQKHSEGVFIKLYSTAFAMSYDLPVKETAILKEDLELIHEVYILNPKASIFDKKIDFYDNLLEQICHVHEKDPEVALKDLIKKALSYEVLAEVSDEDLLKLYNRIKENTRIMKICPELIDQVYLESKIRYSCAKVPDSTYKLQDVFSLFDSISYQIRNLKNQFIKHHLFKSNPKIQLIELLSAHTDNICFFKMTSDKSLITILNIMCEATKDEKKSAAARNMQILDEMRSKMDNAMDPMTYKKYKDLDLYQAKQIKTAYNNAFFKIAKVLEAKDQDYSKIVNELFIDKLVDDYYLPHSVNSTLKVRNYYKNQSLVRGLVQDLNLIAIFDEGNINGITLFDYRNQFGGEISTPESFVQDLIRAIFYEASPSQLESIYKPLVQEKGKLSDMRAFLKEEAIYQIKNRTTLSKMLLAIFTGQKSEISRLKKLRDQL